MDNSNIIIRKVPTWDMGVLVLPKTEKEIKSQDENGTILVFSPKLVFIGFSPPIKNLPASFFHVANFPH
jgi:hypothetical protein